ncbi:MAG TPA: NAD(P)H-dependent oxidoreductase subunit E, partial [Candidatus Deferrimicrobiaceae bacterium]
MPTESRPVAPSPEDSRYRQVDLAIARADARPDALIEVLHAARESVGAFDDALLAHVARALGLPLSRVYGVATFYHFFSLSPSGEHECAVCLGTVCHVKGGGKIASAVENAFGVRAGGTTDDGKLSLSVARCLGNCCMAPMATVDGETLANADPASAVARVRAALGD